MYWTYADASRRLDDPMLVGCATAASLFPFIGTIVYTIVRPPEYLEDRHERELEIKAAEKRLALLENRTCRNCGGEVEPSFLRCPSCMRKLKEPCRSCGKPLDPRWRVCPYCEAEVAGFRAASRRTPTALAPRAGTRGSQVQRRVGGGARATRSQASAPGRDLGSGADGPETNSGERPAEAPAREPTSQSPPSSPNR